MTGLIIEGGIYFLILFTPFAFGGVEMWAQGVLQIVAGVVVAAWIWGRDSEPATRAAQPSPAAARTIWIAIACFVLFALLQLVPLPPSWIAALAPGTHDLYARTLPGYAEGGDFDESQLTPWLLARHRDRLPPAEETASPEPGAAVPAAPAAPGRALPSFPPRVSAWRPLTIYPFETWQRLKLLLCFTGLFAVVTSWFRTRERLTRLLAMTVFSGFAVSMVGILQKLTSHGKLLWIREVAYENTFGPYVNRNSYAAFAGAVLPLGVCFALNALGHMEKGVRGALPRLILWGFGMVTTAVGIFYSLSRGGILAAVLSMAIIAGMLLYYGRRGRDMAVLSAMALATVGFLIWIGPEKVIERLGTLSEGQSIPSMELRVVAWRRALGLVASSPIVGSGLGTFRFAYMRFAPPGEGWWTEAHDEYLELLCDTGLIGGAIFLAGFTAWLLIVARPSLFRKTDELYPYIGLVSGVAGLLLHSAVSSNLQVPANGLMLTLMGAALVCLVGGRSATRRGRSRSPGREQASAAARVET